MLNWELTRFWIALISFLCLSLSVLLTVSNARGQETEHISGFVSSFYESNRNYCGSERTARALRRIGSKAVPELIKGLQNQDTKLRADAAHLLGIVDKKAASSVIPNLTRASKNDPDPEVRVCAVSALIRIAGNDFNKSTPEVKAVTPAVIAALKDSDTEVRLAAINAFQSLSFSYSSDGTNGELIPELKAAIPVLMELLKDEHEQVRSYATSALGVIGSDTASIVPVLTKALQDSDEKVRLGAVQVLSRISIGQGNNEEAASAVSALIEAFKQDKNVEVRSNAALALRNMGEKAASAVPALIEALTNEKDPQVRSSAVSALENIGEKATSAVPALIEALQDETLSWYGVTQSLGRIAENWQDNASKLSNQDLDKAISDLETALKIVEAKAEFIISPNVFADEGKKRLDRCVNFLKKEKLSRSLGSKAYKM
ncbi:HEAT repeat domain-containing protein [Tolypothrix campylonemoides VB511288]|nr:HEAT repeat domain-containing protein [Tolypothrix campylonemoides VB511288]